MRRHKPSRCSAQRQVLRNNTVAITAQQMAVVPELGLGTVGIDQLRAHLLKPGDRGHPALILTQPGAQQHRYSRIRQALHTAPVKGIQVMGRTTRLREVSAGLRVDPASGRLLIRRTQLSEQVSPRPPKPRTAGQTI